MPYTCEGCLWIFDSGFLCLHTFASRRSFTVFPDFHWEATNFSPVYYMKTLSKLSKGRSWILRSGRLASDFWFPKSSLYNLNNFQARELEWVTVPFPRGSSQPRDWTRVSCIADRFFSIWANRKPIFWGIVDLKCYSFQVYDILIQYMYWLCSV